jgi:predicted nuclease of predicted toxin-antitoxin system
MSRLLLDQNLSRRLVTSLAPQFPGSAHVADMGMSQASDREIFDFARANEFAILSKDSDFDHLSFRFGAPPKVIWVRLGNASTSEIGNAVLRGALRIRRFLADDESTLMVISRGDG